MRSTMLIFVPIICALILLTPACSNKHSSNTKLIGEWHCKKDGSKLKITDKAFAMDAPEPEDYFVKGDTIYTSFEGNLPYTKYAIKKLTANQLTIFTPDSTTMEYER